MPRIYSNYSNEEIALLKKESEQKGLSLSAYQKYRTLLSLTDSNSFNIADLISKLKDTLYKKKKGDLFIASSLVSEEWPSLTRSQKNTLSKTLKKIVTDNPKSYEINAVLPGGINQYVVLSNPITKKTTKQSDRKEGLFDMPYKEATELFYPNCTQEEIEESLYANIKD